MSVVTDPEERGSIAARLAAARGAPRRADVRLSGAIDDFFLPAEARLNDRLRHAIGELLVGTVDAIQAEIRRYAARLLAGQGEQVRAEAMARVDHIVAERLSRAGLLRERALMDELISRARADLIARALPIGPGSPDRPSLLVRLADAPDGVIAGAATALLAAEARRRTANENGQPAASDLPAGLHRQLVWWVAAAIRQEASDRFGEHPAADRAVVEAAQRSLAAHDEAIRPEFAAQRLAIAVDAQAHEVGALLIDALGDRQMGLFLALLARATGIGFDAARSIVVEPEGDRLWLALRALSLDRPTIATVALALAEADQRRDIEAFAEALDSIVAMSVEEARAALAPLTLDAEMRFAIDALARGERR